MSGGLNDARAAALSREAPQQQAPANNTPAQARLCVCVSVVRAVNYVFIFLFWGGVGVGFLFWEGGDFCPIFCLALMV